MAAKPANSITREPVGGYRVVFKGYLADPDLQDDRARWPFVSIRDNYALSWQGRQSIVQAGVIRSQARLSRANHGF